MKDWHEGASLLVSQGHSWAFLYPIWRLRYETQIVQARMRRELAENVSLQWLAIGDILTAALGGKPDGTFKKTITEMLE